MPLRQPEKSVASRPSIAGQSSKGRALVTLSAAFAALSAFFGVVFYARYYRYRDCIDALENSSCVDTSGGNLTGGGVVWLLFSVFPAVLSLTLLWLAVLRRRRINAAAGVGREGRQ